MILDEIISYKKDFVALCKKQRSQLELEKLCHQLPPTLGFTNALKNSPIGVIAEIKKASPSKGLIRQDFDINTIATAYQNSPIACVSCLTDEKFFQGSELLFKEARKILDKPMIRKDFTVDPYQVFEARAMGADAILLIAAALTDSQLKSLFTLANDLGLDTLFEVHNKEELDRVLPLDPPLIGINNRDLKTFHTDIQTTIELLPFIPQNKTIISESALSSRLEIQRLAQKGVKGFLIGETFMRDPKISPKIKELFPELY